MKTKQSSQLALLRTIALAEGCSFLLLLFVAMPLKYIFKMPEAVKIVGSLHGGLFVLFVLASIVIGTMLRWKLTRIAFALAMSVLPFGPFIFEAQLRKEALANN